MTGGPRISGPCDGCGELMAAELAAGQLSCPACLKAVNVDDEALQLRACPLCGCSRLYRQKDFPRGVGIAVVAVGAVLVPFTYGISLVVTALIDLLLFRRVPVMAVCYLCRAELRGLPIPERILPFRHHMAEGFEKRREQMLLARQRRAGSAATPPADAEQTPGNR